MNVLGKANYFCHYIVSSFSKVVERDKLRKDQDKSVGSFVIDDIAENQQIPTMREGFVSVNIIGN